MREEFGLGKVFPPGRDGILPAGHSSVADIRRIIESEFRRAPKAVPSVDLPISPAAKKSLGIAAAEAEKAGDQRIEPGHLLLGLLLDEGSRVSELLRQSGVTAESILQMSGEASGPLPRNQAAQMLAQLSALIEVLIKQGVFSRQDLAEELANRYILPDLHATLNSLLSLLVRKGVINETDRRNIGGLSNW